MLLSSRVEFLSLKFSISTKVSTLFNVSPLDVTQLVQVEVVIYVSPGELA